MLATSHPRLRDLVEERAGQVQTCRRCGDCPVVPGVDRLIARDVIGPVVALDVRGQGNVAAREDRGIDRRPGGSPERNLEATVLRRAAKEPDVESRGRGFLVRTARRDLHVCAELERLARPSERPPDLRGRRVAPGDLDLARADASKQEHLDPAPRLALAADEPSGHDAGVVDHEQRARRKQRGQGGDAMVRRRTPGGRQLDEPRSLPMLDGTLGDELGGKLVVKGVDAQAVERTTASPLARQPNAVAGQSARRMSPRMRCRSCFSGTARAPRGRAAWARTPRPRSLRARAGAR